MSRHLRVTASIPQVSPFSGEIALPPHRVTRVFAVGTLVLCLGCQSLLNATTPTVDPPHARSASARQVEVFRRVLMTSEVAPLRAQAAKELGMNLSDDPSTLLALSVATHDRDQRVIRAARRALVSIYDARSLDEDDATYTLLEFRDDAIQKTDEIGNGAVTLVQWLLDHTELSL